MEHTFEHNATILVVLKLWGSQYQRMGTWEWGLWVGSKGSMLRKWGHAEDMGL